MMNFRAIKVIYLHEMLRFWQTLFQSVASPILSTALYFVVFGAAIGSRISNVEGVSYGLFIIPGLTMLSVLTQSIANASFGIFFPKFTGTIYEILSAPISFYEALIGFVGAAASKSLVFGSYYSNYGDLFCRPQRCAPILDVGIPYIDLCGF